MTKAQREYTVGLALLLCAIVAPFALPGRYFTTQLTLFFIWATVATQWNLVLGVGGIFSLAQMGLFACGAYGTAMLGFYLGWPMWLAMIASVVLAVGVSILTGLA